MGRKSYLVDTNITIYYFGLLLSKKSETFLDDILKNKYYISVVNRIELLGNKGISQKEQNALDSFINNAIVFNLDEEIILETINIRKKYAIKLPDAIIAATCLLNNCQLITNNTKDFAKIEGLSTLKATLSE
ncbi:MAG: type II toxin-antitoxin system VapC family toxin [Bacteroidales bacterium]|jgi:predicted nucleic acid-binding protein|nr:type II toxin-antitoxin system VapC family toxin [Bacteroidales bacterium]